ncbi:hypothetical protein HK405_004335 [Cladochytrium tenue]|nr:hypothetical protein HK405_004335 [Cladochytrium tenue]
MRCDVSGNCLYGALPATLTTKFPNSFSNEDTVCTIATSSSAAPSATSTSSTPSSSSGLSTSVLAAAIAVPICVVAIAAVVIFGFIWYRRKKQEPKNYDSPEPTLPAPTKGLTVAYSTPVPAVEAPPAPEYQEKRASHSLFPDGGVAGPSVAFAGPSSPSADPSSASSPRDSWNAPISTIVPHSPIGSPVANQRYTGVSRAAVSAPQSMYDDGAPASEILRRKGFPDSVVEAFKGRAISVAEFLELAESSTALARAQMELALEDPKLRMRVADVANFVREERARLPPRPVPFIPAPAAAVSPPSPPLPSSAAQASYIPAPMIPPTPAWATSSSAAPLPTNTPAAVASTPEAPPASPTSGPVAPRRIIGASVRPPQ